MCYFDDKRGIVLEEGDLPTEDILPKPFDVLFWLARVKSIKNDSKESNIKF